MVALDNFLPPKSKQGRKKNEEQELKNPINTTKEGRKKEGGKKKSAEEKWLTNLNSLILLRRQVHGLGLTWVHLTHGTQTKIFKGKLN